MKYKMLVITDHSTHRDGESIYPLLKAMNLHIMCEQIDIVSRGNKQNDAFFYEMDSHDIFVKEVSDDFNFNVQDYFVKLQRKETIKNYDVVFMRIDRPVERKFIEHIASQFQKINIVNNPDGVEISGSKKFLLEFQELCPPIKLCYSIADILDAYDKHPIVLKPLESYGGKGILRIKDGKVMDAGREYDLDNYLNNLEQLVENGLLAMQYLKNVNKGDKRVIVVNGEIMGAILRTPPPNSFICNLSQGGTSSYSRLYPDFPTS